MGEPESFLPGALRSEEGGWGSIRVGRQCAGHVARVTMAVLCLSGPWACRWKGGPALPQRLAWDPLPLTCPALCFLPSVAGLSPVCAQQTPAGSPALPGPRDPCLHMLGCQALVSYLT